MFTFIHDRLCKGKSCRIIVKFNFRKIKWSFLRLINIIGEMSFFNRMPPMVKHFLSKCKVRRSNPHARRRGTKPSSQPLIDVLSFEIRIELNCTAMPHILRIIFAPWYKLAVQQQQVYQLVWADQDVTILSHQKTKMFIHLFSTNVAVLGVRPHAWNVSSTLPRNNIFFRMAAIAQWICLGLLSCGPGFESQA